MAVLVQTGLAVLLALPVTVQAAVNPPGTVIKLGKVGGSMMARSAYSTTGARRWCAAIIASIILLLDVSAAQKAGFFCALTFSVTQRDMLREQSL